MKKIISLVLCLVLAFSHSVYAYAAGSSAKVVSTASAQTVKAGDTVTITVSLSDCAPFRAMALTPEFDKDVFELQSGEWLLTGALIADFNGANAVVAYSSAASKSGAIFKYVLKVKDIDDSTDTTIKTDAVIQNGATIINNVAEASTVKVVAAGRATLNGSDTVTVGSNVELTVNVKNCEESKSAGIEIAFDDAFELVSGSWLKDGTIIDFDTATKKGALGGLTSLDVNGDLFKIVLRAKTVSANGANVSVHVVAKNGTTEVLNVNATKVLKISCINHTCGEWTEIKAPTCTESGTEESLCSVCKSTVTKDITALGHNLVNHEAKAPTCTEIGWEAYDTCSRCDYTTYEELAALGHNLVNHDAKAPTCTENGWKAYNACTRCDYTTYMELAALGHTLATKEENRVEATCTTDGSYDNVVYCSVCEAEFYRETVVIDALGHNLVNHEAKTPSCTENGWEAYNTCTRCDYTTYMELSALGHTLATREENRVEATCTEQGSYENVVYCTVCEVELSRETVVIEALGHDLVNHEAKAPTCTENGWKAYDTCSSCDYTTYEELSANGHSFGEWVVVKEPTETENGKKVATCSACQETKEEIIPCSVLSGDVDGSEEVTDADAEYLLMYTFFPEDYPINQDADFTGDGSITDADAEYLLMFTFFPEDYPLNTK